MSTSVTSSHQAEVTVDTATIEVITGIAAGVVSPDAPARAHVTLMIGALLGVHSFLYIYGPLMG